jgi:hypothetical protein
MITMATSVRDILDEETIEGTGLEEGRWIAPGETGAMLATAADQD